MVRRVLLGHKDHKGPQGATGHPGPVGPQGISGLTAATTVTQNYHGSTILSCPAGYTVLAATCDEGATLVLNGQTPGPNGWYLGRIPHTKR